jgi:DNA polymerase-1
VPIDVPALERIKLNWEAIQVDLVTEIDAPFGCYEIRDGAPHWVKERFAACIRRRGIPWPRHPSGVLDETAETFKEMGKAYPEIEPLRELRSSMSKLRLSGLQIGSDNRNRTLLLPFGSKTSRNQPSATKYIFGPAKWLRFFISPPPGWALIYRDYAQQEVCIAAWLSQDQALLAACATGDVYLGIAKQLGFVPQDATDESHPNERALFKTVVLGIQYGLGSRSLALRTGILLFEAAEILSRLRARYRTFEDYAARIADHAGLFLEVSTALGWRMKCPPAINPRTVRNFMFQATGGDILRTASILGERRGLEIVAPIHDAILAQCPLDQVEEASLELDRCMRDASAVVLRGYTLKTDKQIIKPGEHYYDKRGIQMWTTVNKLVTRLEQGVA